MLQQRPLVTGSLTNFILLATRVSAPPAVARHPPGYLADARKDAGLRPLPLLRRSSNALQAQFDKRRVRAHWHVVPHN
jgi:hypothetical protein